MKAPKLKKRKKVEIYHGHKLIDNYSWVHQENILEVLSNPKLLNKEVREHLESENLYADDFFKSEKKVRTKLFNEIKGRIKLADKSVPFRDTRYSYWTKTTEKGNYFLKLRKKHGSKKNEIIWNGDREKKNSKSAYFGVGSLTVSNNDKYLAYSLDLKGSEYYDIRLRNLKKIKSAMI